MLTGGCACGALRYRAGGEPLLQGFCHCRNCQRLSGSGHVGFICFPESAVMIEGATTTYAVTGGSGLIATRYSCPTCHGMVFGRAEVIPGQVNFYAGSLDDLSQFKPEIAIYVRSRPAWDDVSRGLPSYETVPAGQA